MAIKRNLEIQLTTKKTGEMILSIIILEMIKLKNYST